MALVTHMLAHVVPMDARPFGAALLTARLILPGTPRTPARSALFFRVAKKTTSHRPKNNRQNQKQTHPRPPVRQQETLKESSIGEERGKPETATERRW